MENGVFDEWWKAQFENWAELEQSPFLNYTWAVTPEARFGWVGPIKGASEKVKRRLVVGVSETRFSVSCEVLLQGVEEFRVGCVELGDDVAASGPEEVKEEALQRLVFRLGWVKVG